jgi:hypothetical protein
LLGILKSSAKLTVHKNTFSNYLTQRDVLTTVGLGSAHENSIAGVPTTVERKDS